MIDKNVITRQLQDWIDQMERSGKHVNLDDINRHGMPQGQVTDMLDVTGTGD